MAVFNGYRGARIVRAGACRPRTVATGHWPPGRRPN